MITSMTGYGRSLKENADCQVTVEMKAVNHRFCEINIRMPRQFFFLEDQLKKTISRFVKRGKVDVFINISGEGIVNRTLAVNWELLSQYHSVFSEMKEKFGSNADFPLNSMLANDAVVEIQESDEVDEGLKSLVVSAAEDAVLQLVEMRKKEGLELYEDVHKRIGRLSDKAEELKEFAPAIQKNYLERLTKKVRDFTGSALEIDESRVLTEVAVYADKSDIEEELTRIQSHLKQFNDIISSEKVVGRKLDFIVQELNRETNTIGSKSNDVTISKHVVEIKSELEKIREQVQNIE
ncbi:YicC family protein [Evansella sp. LMS18]|uniref:YicC/YloC family endoribonuclease n=1 Tax=Evansella sp. LMS18 TaxID=2924033 RepID=UPI0020D1752D|nr:YicC/YloC family endoribonuclease [Evansella sp. LMS18]UTR10935.1 YicC family protein [Evansella sp. LMS18]